ncbi:MAG: bacterioferritin-associated ferredoxin [Rudaea sp.]|uniref:(2Fe-2S)-binding protein n=1 Tax=Rudaea sp. TaxID=2136325 RepID=UPI0039E5FFD4
MYVCICNAVTDKMIREAAAEGVSSLAELTRRTGCSGDCGSCADLAEEILRDARGRRPRVRFGLPLVAQAA